MITKNIAIMKPKKKEDKLSDFIEEHTKIRNQLKDMRSLLNDLIPGSFLSLHNPERTKIQFEKCSKIVERLEEKYIKIVENYEI